jgi:hypothetical protein
MILRRVIKHFREQEWTAIFLDFLIVVVGVFVGLQVSNWNAARADRVEESRLLTQLQMDVSAALELKIKWITRISQHRQSLAAAINVVQNDPDTKTLNKAYCNALWSSHIILYPSSKMVTLEEMLSTGGLGVIRDKILRSALLNYQTSRDALKDTNAFVRSDLANVVDEYSSAFPRKLVDQNADAYLLRLRPAGDKTHLSNATTVACQLDVIRADQTIQNKLLSNMARTDVLVRLANTEIADMRQIALALKGKTP